jgi:transcriptional regulator with XRE-family HTH domain
MEKMHGGEIARELILLAYKTTLKEVLKQQGRKQSWLCEQTGIHPTWMTKLVNGTSLPRVDHAILISRALGVPIEELWPLDSTDRE